MITYPNCKINIGLQVMRRRADGYHNLETLFYPVPLCDKLDIEPADSLSFQQTGITIDCPAEDNICLKAYHLLHADHPNIAPVRIMLEKNIPFGAGLGGGSADAAFTLKMLNEIFSLNLSNHDLKTYAACLGADCAFFIDNRPSFATGIGDVLEPFDTALSGNYLLLVKPNEAVSTKEAYSGVKVRNCDSSPLRHWLTQPLTSWRDKVVNDFESSVFAAHPRIAELKALMYAHGATYAAMSGSGATVYGLFSTPPHSLTAHLHSNEFVYQVML